MGSPQELSIEEAAGIVASGDHVVLGCLAAEPVELVAALCRRAGELRDVTITSGVLLDNYPMLDTPIESFRYRTWLMPTRSGTPTDPARIDFMPLSWAQAVSWLGTCSIDVAMVQVAEGHDGTYSLGTSVSYGRVAVEHARTVIACVNPHMPYTHGDTVIPASDIDIVVRVDRELPVLSTKEPDAIDEAIARDVASTISSGSLLQVGVGTLPDAVVKELVTLGRTELRQYSMLTDSFLELAKQGALATSGAQAIVGEIVGSPALYDAVRDNAAILMADGRRTHTLTQLLGRERLVILGSALEIDLFGQANLELLGGAQFSGVGGAMDYAAVAALAPESAQSVLMLRSTTSRGAPRIVPRLTDGLASLPRTLVRRVVTEHGSATLDGCSVRERAESLIAIAAPEHRAALIDHLESLPRLYGA